MAMVETTTGGKVSADTVLGQLLSVIVLILGTVFNSMLIYGVLNYLNFTPQ